jgi:hypothetical protein
MKAPHSHCIDNWESEPRGVSSWCAGAPRMYAQDPPGNHQLTLTWSTSPWYSGNHGLQLLVFPTSRVSRAAIMLLLSTSPPRARGKNLELASRWILHLPLLLQIPARSRVSYLPRMCRLLNTHYVSYMRNTYFVGSFYLSN